MYALGVTDLDLDNFQLSKKGTFSGQQAYKNSKLCNILFTYQLADSLVGTGVTVNAVNPGEWNVGGTHVVRCRNITLNVNLWELVYLLDGLLGFTDSWPHIFVVA